MKDREAWCAAVTTEQTEQEGDVPSKQLNDCLE